MQGKRRAGITLLAALSPLLLPHVSSAEEPAGFHEPNAVVVNLAEEDLNLLLREVFLSAGGSRIEGEQERVSKGVSELRYRVDLSEPVLELGESGRLSLRLDVLEADVRIGRLERRVGKRLAHCVNAGISVRPGRPLELNAAFRFELTDGVLRVVPEALSLDHTKKDLHLLKPTACHNAVLPRWLLWWIGKPRLRRRIDRLDDALLARMQRNAEDLSGPGDLLHESWQGDGGELYLYPRTLETNSESLLMFLAGSSREGAPAGGDRPEWVAGERGRSFLGLSESFLNRRLALAFSGERTRPSKPKDNLRRLARSRSLLALVPGLRGNASTENIHFSITFPAPTIELDSIGVARAGLDPSVVREPVVHHGERALIRLLLSDVELNIWEFDGERHTPLGTITIDSGRVAVVPFVSILGGVSLALVENEWRLSSEGVAVDEPLLEATIQEMVFGEVFQTKYDPLAREALRIGGAEIAPVSFRTIDDHLVIGLSADPDRAPRQTDNLLASR